MKVLLIHPWVPMELQYGKKYKFAGAVLPPLGLMYIASYLRKHDIQANVIDANALGFDADRVMQDVEAYGPDLIGLSSTTLAFRGSLAIAERVRKKLPGVPVVVGGPHAQGAHREIIEKHADLIDYACIGEGEESMLQLCRALDAGDPVETAVTGFSYFAEGEVKDLPATPAMEDLDALGSPARFMAPFIDKYHQKALGYRRLPMTTLFTQRGCPFKCVFCSSPIQFENVFNNRVRAHSVDWIMEEIGYLTRDLGVREIYFADDTFNLKRTRLMEVSERIGREFGGLLWSCNFEVNIATRNLLKTMRDGGCWQLLMGSESGNQHILETIRKGITTDQIKNVARWCNEVGIAARTSFIIGHPNDTPETIAQTVEFAKSLQVPYVTFALMLPLPGAEMWEMAEHYGKFDVTDTDEFTVSKANYHPHGLTKEFMERVQKKAHKDLYFNWKMMVRHLKLIRSLPDVYRYTRGAIAVGLG